MDVTALIRRIQARPDYAGQLEHLEVLPERPGRFAVPDEPLAAPASQRPEFCHRTGVTGEIH